MASDDLPVAGASEPLMRKLMEEAPQAIADCLMRMSKGIAELNQNSADRMRSRWYLLQLRNQANFFSKEFHANYVAPSEQYVLNEAKKIRDTHILHICGYHGNGNDLTLFTGYNAAAYSVAVNAEGTTMSEAKKLFGGKAVIGGFAQDGIIYKGSQGRTEESHLGSFG